MSGSLTKQYVHRDYGATSSGVNSINSVPDVNFSGFSPTEFISLSESTAQNINSINSCWSQLKKELQLAEAKNYSSNLDERVQKIQNVANEKIEATSKDLQRLSAVVRRGDKQQKLQVEKLTTDFRDVVQKYSSFQQNIVLKMKKMYLQNVHSQIDDEEASRQSGSDKEQLIREMKQMRKDLQFEQDVFMDREARIKEIEANVIDANALMRELSAVIKQQEESIGTLESNVEQVNADVEAGTSQLIKAESRVRHRRKVLIILVIAVIVGIIVTGIIISQLKR